MLQAGGRGMRPFEGKEECIIADHGGNIYRLGRLDLARDWELSTDVKIQDKLEDDRKKKEKMCVTCPGCGLIHSSGSCPRCHAAPKEAKDRDYIKAMLEQMTVFEWESKKPKKEEKPKKVEATMFQKQEWFSGFLTLADQRG